MSTQVQIRRDSAANLASVTPVAGEAGYDTTNKNLIVGDGSRVGGIPHPSYAHIQNQRFTFATSVGGTANAITIDLAEDLDAYAQGVVVEFEAASNNTGATTLNVSGLGVKTLKKISSGGLGDLSVNDLVSGVIYRAVYDGTYFQLINLAAQSGGRVLLETKTISGDSTIDFTSSMAGYSRYEIELIKVLPSTDNTELRMRCSTGGTFSSATAYVSAGVYKNGTNAQSNWDLTSSYLTLSASVNVGNSTNEIGVDSIISLSSPSSTGMKVFKHSTSYVNSSGNPHSHYGTLSLTASPFLASGIDGVRFYFSSGNLSSGTIKLYGIL